MASLTTLSFAHPVAKSDDRAALTLAGTEATAVRHLLIDAGRRVFLLFTCLRVEIAWQGGADDVDEILRLIYGEIVVPSSGTIRGDEAAFLHLCRVAAGLDSPMTGEREVLSQFRKAVSNFHQADPQRDGLSQILDQAVGVARAGRRRLGNAPHGSLASVAASAASRFARVAILGSGAMAKAAAMQLPDSDITVFARSGEPVAGRVPIPWDRAAEALAEFPVVISTVPGTEPLFSEGVVAKSIAGRIDPLFLIDLSMPPGFEPFSPSDSVRYMGVDEVASIVDHRPAIEVEETVAAAARAAWLRLAAAERVGAVVAAILGHADRAVGEEVRRFLKRLPVDGDPEPVLTQLAHTVARRMLHPTVAYVSSTERGSDAVELFAEVFGVDDV